MARILLAEADASTRISLGTMLEADRHSVLLVTSPIQLVSALSHGRFDTVIVDLAMVRAGDEAVELLRETPVIGLEPRDYAPSGAALSVVARLFRPVDLQAARVFVTSALALTGTASSADELFGPQGVSARPTINQAYVSARPLSLTARELALLVLLLRRRGEAVPVADLAVSIWGFEQIGSRNFIEAHVSRLRRKLRDAGAAGAIQTVRGIGYQVPA